ncbi:MAG: adenylate/guanylate cyclase domain-containing protein [Gammaproteobacteria bacterium]|nr:adenylate/guanylate cyclase domain-containing protein [Gammaproteobacteria bacterium]
MIVSQNYELDFDHPVERLWAVVSDTPRWGEALGMPRYQASEELQSDGRVTISGKLEIAGMTIAWEEPPVNWIAERWFEQRRIFTRGPINSMTTHASLEDRGGGSGLYLELTFDTRNLIGTFIGKRMLAVYEDKVRALLQTADRLIRAEQSNLFESDYQPSRTTQARAARVVDSIAGTPYEHGLGQRLVDYINHSQVVDLWAMRPIEIARRWGSDSLDTIELFLQSVRSGLLESRWDILCPRCRITKSTTSNIGELPRGVHCDACNIDFESDFASNVELSFSPSPSIRPVEYGFYCRSGPGVTPHIKGQFSLAPGEHRSLPLALKPGVYRLRTLEAGDELEIDWSGGPFPEIHVSAEQVTVGGDSANGLISMTNDGELTRSVVIEEQSWLRDVLTAERVTTMQAFRDLFSDQVLRPGDEVSIRNIAFVFTDLVGSSDLFSRIGDAAAYQLVREHFAEVGEIIRRHQGSIVKTMGDGVHAAFLSPDDALRASIEMQLAMPGFNRRFDAGEVSIRIGLHAGNSIAVTLNNRLDYYGEAVNLAARLEGQGQAGDIIMSKAFSGDPAVSDILSAYEQQPQDLSLKGFSDPVAACLIHPLSDDEQTKR